MKGDRGQAIVEFALVVPLLLVLILGVLVSMFTAITVTRTVLRFVVERDSWRKAWLYGVSESEFIARPSADVLSATGRSSP